jgi:hypothetical protein
MYDYEDYWDEPSEFEMQIEEFKISLRSAVKGEIKEKIESLEKELADLKLFRDERDKFVQECNDKIAEAKRETIEAKATEEKWKKARLYQLLGEHLIFGWGVDDAYEYGEKCEKCDDNRKIHFTSPQGRKYEEDCQCSKKHYTYSPKLVELLEFSVKKKNFYPSDADADFRNRYYYAEEDRDYERFRRANDVYTSSDIDFEDVNQYCAVFLNEEDCQKYCDWKNEKERNKSQ